MAVDIPRIIEPELWRRVQRRLDRNKTLSRRNAKGIYLLQGLAQCGECGNSLSVSRQLSYMGGFGYKCHTAMLNPHEPHPRPYNHSGGRLDWAVWRRIVDYGIKQPDLIRKQVQKRQAELQAQGDSVEGDIAHAQRRLDEVARERKSYHRQKGRGKITEEEYDELIDDTKEAQLYWESELARLRELRDNQAKVRAGLDYATRLLTALQSKLLEIDIPPDELKALPKEKQTEILKERQKIVRALCDKVVVYADRRTRIEGLLDGSEAAQFELLGS